MNSWQIKVLIDGACPLCRREVDLWQWLDRRRGRIALVDIAAAGFDPREYGLTREQAMEKIYGVLPSGATVSGMEVFRRAYRAVGWGWLLAPTGWPILRGVFDRAYEWFARNRLKITGRLFKCTDSCSSRKPVASRGEVSMRVGGGTPR